LISTVGYNESVAQEAFPLTKEEALKQWFIRCEYEKPSPQISNAIKASELPNITEVTDEILQQPIICAVTGKPFKLVWAELEFYRKHHLPIPHTCREQRRAERMKMRNPRKLRDRTCDKCWIDIKTSYAPERKEIVYCEACYNKEIYW
jgi:hypothetical protein